MIRYNALNERYAYESQQADNYAQANIYRAQAANAKSAGRIGLFNTVLGAGLQLAGNLYSEDSAAVQGKPKEHRGFKKSLGRYAV
jgi:hypothetical protein